MTDEKAQKEVKQLTIFASIFSGISLFVVPFLGTYDASLKYIKD